MKWDSLENYTNIRATVITDLGKALNRGELAIILGAGVSVPFGLPSWSNLLVECGKLVGLTFQLNTLRSSAAKLAAADDIRRKCSSEEEYLNIVRDVLYGTSSKFTPTDLTLAITSLLSGTARGKVSRVVTLNFDDIIETFLLINGYDVQIVSKWPQVIRDADVTIYHPHGFLPRKGGVAEAFFSSSSSIVFSDSEFKAVLSKRKSMWREELRSLIQQKVILTIGLGPGEPHLRALFESVALNVTNRPLAFWMYREADTKKTIGVRNQTFYEKCRAVPLPFEQFTDYAEFLAAICRSAALNRLPTK